VLGQRLAKFRGPMRTARCMCAYVRLCVFECLLVWVCMAARMCALTSVAKKCVYVLRLVMINLIVIVNF